MALDQARRGPVQMPLPGRTVLRQSATVDTAELLRDNSMNLMVVITTGAGRIHPCR